MRSCARLMLAKGLLLGLLTGVSAVWPAWSAATEGDGKKASSEATAPTAKQVADDSDDGPSEGRAQDRGSKKRGSSERERQRSKTERRLPTLRPQGK